MPLRHPPTIALGHRDLSSLAAWQAALDARDFLVRLELTALRAEPSELSHGVLGGRTVEFTCERRGVADLAAAGGPSPIGSWAFAYAFRGLGTLETSVAANMVAISYAAATGGALFDPKAGCLTDFDAMRRSVDTVLAGLLDRMDLFVVRYPETADQPAEQGDAIVASVRAG